MTLALDPPTHKARALILAARPRTLTIALAPIMVASALGLKLAPAFDARGLALALLTAVAIQIGTNLFNDAADGARGHDGPDRLGPPRMTGERVLTERDVRAAGLAMFALAGFAGLGAVAFGGWPILLIGVASVLAGLSYSDGPLPIAFTPFGEVFVTLFFGVAAVMGTTWLIGAAPSLAGLLAGVAVGLPAAAVLLVNNHRDRVADERNGRRTLAILIGPARSVELHFALLVAPLVLGGFLALLLDAPTTLICFAMLAPALMLRRLMRALPIGPGLNRVLGLTALYQLGFAVLLALGLLTG